MITLRVKGSEAQMVVRQIGGRGGNPRWVFVRWLHDTVEAPFDMKKGQTVTWKMGEQGPEFVG